MSAPKPFVAPMRICYGPPHAYEGTNFVNDILVMHEGPTQYDIKPPWRDLGATRNGFDLPAAHHVQFLIVESLWLPRELKSGSFTLGLIAQRDVRVKKSIEKKIVGSIFSSVTIIEERPSRPRGENSTLGLLCAFVDSKEIR